MLLLKSSFPKQSAPGEIPASLNSVARVPSTSVDPGVHRADALLLHSTPSVTFLLAEKHIAASSVSISPA